MRERSRSYVTEKKKKRNRQDSQKQSDMNFKQFLRITTKILDNEKAIFNYCYDFCNYINVVC